jgi:hypothetical protein
LRSGYFSGAVPEAPAGAGNQQSPGGALGGVLGNILGS